MTNLLLKRTTVYLILLPFSIALGYSQFLRTSYFMEGSSLRQNLNPALQPTRGYLQLISLDSEMSSNTLGISNMQDIIDSGNGFNDDDKLYDRLNNNNNANLNINLNLLSIGWYHGKSFWSVNVGGRINAGMSIPKSMFDFTQSSLEEESEFESSNIQDMSLKLMGYTQLGIGYSRPINKRITIGARAKLLLGMANADMKIDELSITRNEENSTVKIKSQAHLYAALHGMGLKTDENGIINDLDFKKFGIAGYGGAIDLGMEYRLTKNITLSTAINDLGFISWSKNSFSYATSNTEREMSQEEYDNIADGTILDFDLFGLKKEEQQPSHRTSLYSTLVIGGEYMFAQKKLSLGVLSTTFFTQPKTLSEITLSATVRPSNGFNLALSYSGIQSHAQSVGIGLKLGSLLIGSDYLFFGKNTRTFNLFFGFSHSIGKKKPTLDN